MNREPYILKETVRGIQSVAIADELLGSRQIFLTEEVNTSSCASLLKQLMYLEQSAPGEEITLYINSPGGEVTSGLAVYDFIKLMQSTVRTVCTGTAASMGSILFLAGEKREMLLHTKIMIHDPSCSASIAGVKPLEVQKKVDALMETRRILCEIIAERTGRSIKEVYKKTKEDTYFTAEEAVKFGIATDMADHL